MQFHFWFHFLFQLDEVLLERKQQLKQLQQQQLDELREEHDKKMKTTEKEYSTQVGTGCRLREHRSDWSHYIYPFIRKPSF